MNRQWKIKRIRDVAVGVFDGPHATPPPSSEGPIYLGIGNISEDGHLDFSDVRHIAEADYPKWIKRVTPTKGDIVFTYEATLNRYALVPDDFRGCLGRRTALIRPDPLKVDVRFLFYSFFGRAWRETIEANRLSGATVDRIPIAKFPNFPINLPPLPLQRRISSILGAYDDLIEVNRRRITVLEEMARRLFDECHARAETRPPDGKGDRSDQRTPVTELISASIAGDWGEEAPTASHTVAVRIIRGADMRRISVGDFSTCPTRFLSPNDVLRKELMPFDVVIENSVNAKTRSTGTSLLLTPGILKALSGPVVAASFCRVLRPTSRASGAVLHAYMQQLTRTREIDRFQVVATNGIANFQSRRFLTTATLSLGYDTLSSLGATLLPFQTTLFAEQMAVLRQQRDMVLPRLISGDLRIDLAERELEEAA